jgi:hypothetical protein
MKLYHWQVAARDQHGRTLAFNLLTVAEDAVSARGVLISEVKRSHLDGGVEAAVVAGLSGDPAFVADPLYPVVIW